MTDSVKNCDGSQLRSQLYWPRPVLACNSSMRCEAWGLGQLGLEWLTDLVDQGLQSGSG
jgi:hypothetical protein